MYLTKFARKVTIIHRRDELRAAKSIQEKAFANEKIHFMWDSVVEEIKGDGLVESMIVKNVKTGVTSEVKADEEDGTFGIFVFIGFKPNSELFQDKVAMNEAGYLLTDDDMQNKYSGRFRGRGYSKEEFETSCYSHCGWRDRSCSGRKIYRRTRRTIRTV